MVEMSCRRCGSHGTTLHADTNIRQWITECLGCGVFIRSSPMDATEARVMKLLPPEQRVLETASEMTQRTLRRLYEQKAQGQEV